MKHAAAQKFATRAIHAGQSPAPGNGAIMTPIYQVSTYVQESPGVHQGYEYARTQNPTRQALEANLAALEGGEYGVCFSSGCAATDAVLHTLSAGDHIVSCNDLYGGTFRLFTKVFGRHGMEFSFVDMTKLENVEQAWKPNTKLIWIETPTNPLLNLINIRQIADFARSKGARVVVDNTFASPYLQNPLEFGADIVVHSSTKYLGGHSDVIGGAVITSDKAIADELYFIQNSVGAVPAPLDCFLLLQSTKTLAIRMQRHCENALELAKFLETRSELTKVIYPGLSSHPQHALAKEQMKDSGGIISIALDGDLARTRRFLEALKVFSLAESLGGVESLANHPAIMTHASIPKEIREQNGVTDSLVRLSVGIEDVEDLQSDLAQALQV